MTKCVMNMVSWPDDVMNIIGSCDPCTPRVHGVHVLVQLGNLLQYMHVPLPGYIDRQVGVPGYMPNQPARYTSTSVHPPSYNIILLLILPVVNWLIYVRRCSQSQLCWHLQKGACQWEWLSCTPYNKNTLHCTHKVMDSSIMKTAGYIQLVTWLSCDSHVLFCSARVAHPCGFISKLLQT